MFCFISALAAESDAIVTMVRFVHILLYHQFPLHHWLNSDHSSHPSPRPTVSCGLYCCNWLCVDTIHTEPYWLQWGCVWASAVTEPAGGSGSCLILIQQGSLASEQSHWSPWEQTGQYLPYRDYSLNRQGRERVGKETQTVGDLTKVTQQVIGTARNRLQVSWVLVQCPVHCTMFPPTQ